MAAKNTVELNVVANADGVQKVFAQVEGRTDGFGKKLGAVFGGLQLDRAVQGLVNFGKESVAAFKESEDSAARLDDAFARFPSLADTNADALRKLNEQLAKKTKFDDDATSSGQAVLAQFGLTGRQVTELTPLLQDYAAKTGKDLPSAADALGKAILGQGRALKEIGIDFKDTGSATGNFEQLVGGLRSQVGGFAEKEGSTAAGQSAILANQFGELQETVGSKLLPVLMRLTSAGLAVVSWLQNLSPGVQQAIVVGVALAGGVFAVVKAVQAWTAVQAALNAVMAVNPIVLVVVAIAALVAALVLAYHNVEWFRDAVDAAFRFVKNVVIGVWDAIAAATSAVWGWLQDAVGAALGFVTNLFLNFTGAGLLIKHWDTIRAATGAVVDFIVGAFDRVVGFFSGLPGRLARVGAGIFDFLMDSFRGALNFIIRAWNRLEFRIPGFDVGPISFGGFTLGVPDIPLLAAGGVVRRPTLAMVGEAGPEAVVPLSRGGVGALGTTINVTVNALDPRSAADAVVKALEVHFGRGGAVSGPGGRSLRPV